MKNTRIYRQLLPLLAAGLWGFAAYGQAVAAPGEPGAAQTAGVGAYDPQAEAAAVMNSLPAGARVAAWANGTEALPKAEALKAPETWSFTPVYTQTLPSTDRWWEVFDDPVLNQLIDKAENANFNIRQALRRMEVARRTMTEARAGYYPTLSANAGYTFTRSSGAISSPAMKGTDLNYLSLGLSMQWEIDLFGRISSQLKADQASLDLSRAEWQSAMVSLCSSLAETYVALRMYQAEYALAQEHIKSQQAIVDMTLARQEAGLADALEVAQANQVLFSTQASLPPLQAMIESSMSSIAVLIGEYPEDVKPLLSQVKPLPSADQNPAIGTPLEMLRRRPDIAQAEAQMALYAAQLGIAKKDYLPTLSLTGAVGVESHKMKNLFTDKGFYYSVAPTLSWTIFDGFARRERTAIAREQMEMGIDNYNQTLLTAVQEVDNARASYKAYMDQCKALDKLVDESKKALDLSVDLYRSTLTPFSNVVDAQMNLLAYQNDRITAQGNALDALIDLYKALGGGW